MADPSPKTVRLGAPDGTGLSLALFASPAGDAEPFLLLRRHPEAAVYLGALLDTSGAVHELLEIWVQRVSGLVACFPVFARGWTNADVDRRWDELRRNVAAADGPATLRLAIENEPGAPLLLDSSLMPAAGADGWELCRDDGALRAKGLPTYSGSLHRYLRNREDDEWVALTPESPLRGGAKPLAEAFPGLVGFNPEGGRVFCRPVGAIGWVDHGRLLRGEPWRTELSDGLRQNLPAVYRELAGAANGDSGWKHFLLPGMGTEAGPREAAYLKISLLHGAIERVSEATRRRAAPFLNLTDEHFGVRLADPGGGLPVLWSARVVLNRAGGAVPTGGEERFYLPDATAAPGPYRMPGPHESQRATGALRIRKLGDLVDGKAAVEATLTTHRDLVAREGFRLEIHFETPAGVIALPGEISAGTTERDWLFAGKANAAGRAALVEGVTHPEVEVLLYPKLGSACDLYALGVLGLQLFFETAERSLSEVVDDVLLLCGKIDATAATLPAALREVAPEWLRSGAAEGVGDLWWEMLSVVVRMLGGKWGYYRAASDGLSAAPEAIYREPLADLGRLARRARALVLGEGQRNLEVREEIAALIAELKGAPASR